MKIFALFLLFIYQVESIKLNNRFQVIKNHSFYHSFDKILYATKNDNRIELSHIAVKNLGIEPFDNWIAKGFFDGDNYNFTG